MFSSQLASSSLPLPLSGLVIAMVVSMLFLLLLRFTAPVMVWVLIIGVLAAGAYGKLQIFLSVMSKIMFMTKWIETKRIGVCFLLCCLSLFILAYQQVDIYLGYLDCQVRSMRPLPLSWWSVCHAGIYHCYWEYENYKNISATISDIGFTTNFNVYLQVQETWLAFCEFDLINLVLQWYFCCNSSLK